MQSANKLREPDPFTREEFLAWRAFLRVHAHVTGELERSGLVKRTRDPEDGRSFLATLTRRGLRSVT